jgi:small-conductance mechanosensitive channel
VSGLEHELMFWVRDPSTVGLASHLVLCAAYDRLRALGVEIPYPQLDVRTRS